MGRFMVMLGNAVKTFCGVVVPLALLGLVVLLLVRGTFTYRGRDLSSPTGFASLQVTGFGTACVGTGLVAVAMLLHLGFFWTNWHSPSPATRHCATAAVGLLCFAVCAFVAHESFFR